MTLSLLVDIFHIAASVALVISAVLLYLELRMNNKLQRAANTESLVSLSAPFNLSLIQDREMAEFFVQGATNFEQMDDVDKYRYRNLISWWLIFHENIYYQRRQGLLDEHSYRPWSVDLVEFVERQKLENQWGDLRHLFQDAFSCHLSAIIQSLQSRKNTTAPPEDAVP